MAVAWRGLACALIAWAAWWLIGPAGLAISALLFAAVLAKPLIELGGEGLHLLRRGVYADVEGGYYAYRGTPIRVVEDDDHRRWVRVDDLRSVLGPGARDPALARLYGDELRRLGARRQAYLSAEAAVIHLARDTRAEANRLRHWLEREVLRPSQVLRGRETPSNEGRRDATAPAASAAPAAPAASASASASAAPTPPPTAPDTQA